MKHIYVIGHQHEAINACLWLASLDYEVRLLADEQDIQATLEHYQFDHQMSALWQLYLAQHKIIISDSQIQAFLASVQAKLLWLFLDDVGEYLIDQVVNAVDSPHSQVILSGVRSIGNIGALAQRIKSSWVYYLPISFMKDGANFNAFYHSDLVMIGEKTKDSVAHCEVLLRLKQHAQNCQIADIVTIEFARSTMMAMLATRLSFMNEMARLADKQGVNIKSVERIIAQDSRIGPAYLSAGWGFGGKTLPHELELLMDKFKQNRVDTSLISAVNHINDDQKELIFRKFWRYFNGFIEQKAVMIWGTGYRKGASRMTHSAIHPLLKLLWSYGIHTRVFTRNTAFEMQSIYGGHPMLTLTHDPYQDLSKVDALFIVNWSLLTQPDVHTLNQVNIPIFDAKNILDDDSVVALTVPYYGIGREKRE
ncbi:MULTISPECIES: UDP-glucose/GDP-mannose dehydrogenase family protein [Moraxella]|uniref:UDP-glucose 6-dehydrogenase n=1 Tax=Moraxella catarrhalis TaxID=480 RepID=A0A7Z0UY54_MORCA|nr:UDP-glucose/GDP-mannose dehydrogenase family protein [Moraxella catarrhalis]OAV00525.1 UDP-glucose dehydrogenase [Moraxella catarrhalis]STY82787.1 UDP-glucose 6-dehydrogenase ywqF [Moraxella catarrhalis]